MIEACHRLTDLGLLAACEGNVSIRLDDHRILCTPRGVRKGQLHASDLVFLDADGHPREGERQPSTELRIHLEAYRAQSWVQAVVHAHPVVATGLAIAGVALPDGLTAEAAAYLGPIPLAPYAMPGTDDLPRELAPYLKDHAAVLMAHHGAVTLGRTIEEACDRMEVLERLASHYVAACQVGGARTIAPDELAPLNAIFRASLTE